MRPAIEAPSARRRAWARRRRPRPHRGGTCRASASVSCRPFPGTRGSFREEPTAACPAASPGCPGPRRPARSRCAWPPGPSDRSRCRRLAESCIRSCPLQEQEGLYPVTAFCGTESPPALVHTGVVALSDLGTEALRLGRFRRHAGSGTWSARFVLEPGRDGEAALDHIEDLAVCMGTAGGLDAEQALAVGVALREAVVNALRHGRSPDGAPTRIGLHLTPDCLVITVRDRGPGFDPATRAGPVRGREPRAWLWPRHLLHATLHRQGFVRVPAQRRLRRAPGQADAALSGARPRDARGGFGGSIATGSQASSCRRPARAWRSRS